MKLGEPQYPGNSRQLPSAERGKSPPWHLLHRFLLGCEGRKCSSGLGWVLALANKASGFGGGHQSCILTRAGWLHEPRVAESIVVGQNGGDAANAALLAGTAVLQLLPGSSSWNPAPACSVLATGISHNSHCHLPAVTNGLLHCDNLQPDGPLRLSQGSDIPFLR